MRSKSASEPWISTCTLSSWPSGKNSRLWSVVKATIAPALAASGLPFAAIVPASQYTNAGVMLKIVPMIMKNQRPTIAWRIWSTASCALSAVNRRIAVACCAEGLGQEHPRHRQRLLGRGAHLGQRDLRLGR